MLAVRIPKELEDQLEELAKTTKRSKSYYVREALEQYLEDYSDYLRAIAALEKSKKIYTLEEVEKRLGLVD